MVTSRSETDTVVKTILPYLVQRGYDVAEDLDFETPLKSTTRYSQGYADIVVSVGGGKPSFLIEAKRNTARLSTKDRDQAIDYGLSLGVPFVVVTNGREFQCYNTKNKNPIRWSGTLIEKIPSKDQVRHVLSQLRTNDQLTDIRLSGDVSLPYSSHPSAQATKRALPTLP